MTVYEFIGECKDTACYECDKSNYNCKTCKDFKTIRRALSESFDTSIDFAYLLGFMNRDVSEFPAPTDTDSPKFNSI